MAIIKKAQAGKFLKSLNSKPDSASSKVMTKDEVKKRTVPTKPKIQTPGIITGFKNLPAKDGKWIQKAINPKHKGFCTPLSKKTCTPRRKALAVTLKKMAKKK